jgi:hypothetical protein
MKQLVLTHAAILSLATAACWVFLGAGAAVACAVSYLVMTGVQLLLMRGAQ